MTCLRLNGYTLNLDQAQLFDRHGQAVELRPQALAVLLELGRRPGELVTKLDLGARVWPGVSVTDDSLVQCVVEIRRALGDSRQQVVRTMPRRGYLLIVDAADTAPRDVRRFYRLAAALAIVAVAIVLVWQLLLPGVGFGPPKVHNRMVADVAVLPLRVLNTSQEGSPDGNGLAYMIASELARNPDLHIVSTLATDELSGKNLSPVQIAAMTHARYLVDGSAERRSDRLQLHVQLIDSGNNRIVWSGRFEPTAQDLPDVTETLISRISASLGATVRESDRAALRSRAPASLDVHARVLRAIALSMAASPEGLRQARQELELAVRLDPNYAPAWACLGLVKKKLIFGNHDPWLSRQDLLQAIADVKHAIALDPLLASSWRSLSLTIESGQTPESAESAVSAAERAIELGPGDPDNWVVLAHALHNAGRTQAAIEAFEKAISWSPLRPPQYASLAARLRYSVQDYENAQRFARECMDRTPAMGFCKAVWLSSLIRTGHAVEAEAEWPALVAAAPSLQTYQMTPRNTPMALSVDEDLNRLRTNNTRAMAQ
ncbi:winged helix-turn-helix domain-containing tetratricopeptide repeat protein [Bradyrhizobium japonicum]|uniref:winged helix-turn-helix domain-containing tetratricopeptide repeat protein n=1 Tax=Bradyrhizobium japonicum TaxID=375 RepID=UPI00271492AC|nr:winged helix-turn-helix domain-containing protein [Bradyrhizobium japonicum]WLB58782.1 winged helix-turn-helix domain-containing protein [Bradyrhizobium japonicum]WLB59417.1 winged helix-turn-helix domain-containing protein [Bradyrhizobium japonicum]